MSAIRSISFFTGPSTVRLALSNLPHQRAHVGEVPDIGELAVFDAIKSELRNSHPTIGRLNSLNPKLGGMTFYNIKGRGRSKVEPVDPNKGILRPTPEFQTRIKCEILVPEHMVRPVVDEILKVINRGSESLPEIIVPSVSLHLYVLSIFTLV